jgi:beta-N-acetylhexosaminidase
MAELSLDEQIGQLLMVGFAGTAPPPQLRELIQARHVGSVILFSRNLRDARQTLELTGELQKLARAAGHPAPLLVATDQENGLVRRLGPDATIFPGNMALGAVGSEQVVFEVAQATGRELKALGINMNLAPVVDVNRDPANPVIGVRSFGGDPDAVARLGVDAVRGYRAAGVIATLKHFPGHGDTAVDSHRTLPVLPHTLERLDAVELVPFRAGIVAGADSIMTAHVALPALTGDGTLPATLAPNVLRGLLRERLGFAGVIISDCLEMEAISATVGTERGAVLALRAGVDLALVSHRHDRQRGSLEAVRAAVRAGELPHEVVRQAAERVLALKRRLLAWEERSTAGRLAEVGSAAHRQLAVRAYEQAITLIRDVDGLVPLRLAPDARILVLFLRTETHPEAADRQDAGSSLLEGLRRHASVSDLTVAPRPTAEEREQIGQASAASDAALLVTRSAHLDRPAPELARCLVESGRPVVGLAARDPYDAQVFPEVGTFLATYEDTPPALAAAVRVLFGEIPAVGHLPVSLADARR